MAATIDCSTRLNGTSLFTQPETFYNSVQKGGRRARDIWIFVVLICEVLVPGFLSNVARKHPKDMHAVTATAKFTEEVAESVRNISCDRGLRDLAIFCPINLLCCGITN